MLTPLLNPFRRRRGAGGGPRRPPVPAPPAPPALVAATYDLGATIELTFDRPIDISAIDVAAFIVDDGGQAGFVYQGWSTPTQTGPASVTILLTGIEDGGDPGTHLTAGAGNGIVAVDGGAAWAGVVELSLPFP